MFVRCLLILSFILIVYASSCSIYCVKPNGPNSYKLNYEDSVRECSISCPTKRLSHCYCRNLNPACFCRRKILVKNYNVRVTDRLGRTFM